MKNIPFILLLVLFTFSNNKVEAQLYKKHADNTLKFYGTLDFRNSPNENNIVEYYGIKLGVGNKSLRFGASYHFLHQNLFSFLEGPSDFFNLPTVSYYKAEYHVVSLFTELIAHQIPRWELLIPIHLGTGYFNQYKPREPYVLSPYNDVFQPVYSGQVHSAVISTKANYRIMKWGGLTSGFGYTFAFTDNDKIQSDLSEWFVSFGIKLFFDEFGSMFKSKEYRKKYLWEPNFVKKYEQTTH